VTSEAWQCGSTRKVQLATRGAEADCSHAWHLPVKATVLMKAAVAVRLWVTAWSCRTSVEIVAVATWVKLSFLMVALLLAAASSVASLASADSVAGAALANVASVADAASVDVAWAANLAVAADLAVVASAESSAAVAFQSLQVLPSTRTAEQSHTQLKLQVLAQAWLLHTPTPTTRLGAHVTSFQRSRQQLATSQSAVRL
jgi:hypothetical protein